ncbi:MAG TPA: choice-of-anchor D domain-containing protein, partial [Bacteroidia bacterium]|nr:choice-of-anchor D domain-containing protein [Bacteroidia bacterium]
MNQMYTQTVSTQDVIQNVSLSGYFGNTLRCISLFMQTGNFWPIGTTSNPNLTVLAGTTAVPNNSTYNFNNVLSTSTATTSFTLQNLGFNTLTFSGSPVIAISGANAAAFTITQPTATSLTNNATTPFSIKFTPGGLGLKTATITIASNDPLQNPYTITLNGTGTATATSPIIGVAQAVTAIAPNGTFNMGTSSTSSNNILRFAIINSGNNALTISSITAAGTGFSVINTVPTTVNYGTADTAYVWIQATSTTAGTLTGSFTINSNDPTNPAYKVNLTATVVACATAVTTNNVYQDFDANYGNSVLSYTNAAWTEKFANPLVNNVNPSYNVAKYVRPATGTYNGVRYALCSGTSSVNLTAAMYDVSVMVYSPLAGVPVTMNLKTAADVANTTTYPATSSVTVTTTKTNQWEILYFNHNAAIGKTGLDY